MKVDQSIYLHVKGLTGQFFLKHISDGYDLD